MNADDCEFVLKDDVTYTNRVPFGAMHEDVVLWVDHLAHRIRDLPEADTALRFYRTFDSMTAILDGEKAMHRRAWYRNFRYMQFAAMYVFVGKALAMLNDLPFPLTEAFGFAALDAASEGKALLMTPDLMRGIFIEWNADGVNKNLMFQDFL
ncbi:hypothetical protein [Jannaschia pohangensis]|uniref:Uncharacterized protein n=1 Tax=Jannaschia pohangensis TaxID=390807 RepID=A0A1I3J199_9RHOB|nr:hypothetical protein [Jannaschia pohangensis]SFI53903.1 hypothetical protein SAMN04488095_1170 [Jannaschia pohangensis]